MSSIRALSRMSRIVAGLVVSAGLVLASEAPSSARLNRQATPTCAAVDGLPACLSDTAFWKMMNEFSEPSGYFRSDNFLSNEHAFQEVIPRFKEAVPSGGVYVGVGPEQNFTYVVALRPKLAFVLDIRRQNLIEQLLYKALIELSADRAEFLSRLFGRKGPAAVDATSTADALFESFGQAETSDEWFRHNLHAAEERLVKHHRFALTAEDLESLEYVYRAFYKSGPELTFSFAVRVFGAGRFPTYRELMTETDKSGQPHSYLATEESFRLLKMIEDRNLIVPVVGDFGGEKALRSIGQYVKDHGATVTAFYTSNVEQYLFEDEAWKKFLANMATLPIDDRSTLLRSVSNRGFQFRLGRIEDLLAAFRDGKIKTYSDVIALSQ